MLDKEFLEKMKEGIDEIIKNLKEDNFEREARKKEEIVSKITKAFNAKAEIQATGENGNYKCKLEGNSLNVLLIIERIKLRVIKENNMPKNIVEATQNIAKEIENIAENEGEENGK